MSSFNKIAFTSSTSTATMGADGQCAASRDFLTDGRREGESRADGMGHWWKPRAQYISKDTSELMSKFGLNGSDGLLDNVVSSGLPDESKPTAVTTRGGGPLDNPGQFTLAMITFTLGGYYLLKQPRSFKSLARSWPQVLGSAAFFDTSLPSAGELDKEVQGNPRARKDRHTSRGPQSVKTEKRSHPKGPKWQRLNGNNGSWTNTDDVAHNGVDGAMLPCYEEESCLEDARGGHFHRRKRAGGKPLSPAARAFLERSQKKGDKKRPSPYSKCASSIELCPLSLIHI